MAHITHSHKQELHVTKLRKALAAFALVATLALPAGVFATDATSDTTETLSVANTISMTAPATATYVLGDGDGFPGQDFGYSANVTVIGSNNPSGVTVKAKVDAYVGPGGITIPTTKRFTVLGATDVAPPASGAALTPVAGSIPLGQFANSTTSKNLASSTGPLANADFSVEFYVAASEFGVGGTYTSAVHYTASTNP